MPDFTPPQSVTAPGPLLGDAGLARLRESVYPATGSGADCVQGTGLGSIDVRLVGSAVPLVVRVRTDLVECVYAGASVATFHSSVLAGWLRRPRGRLVGDAMTWIRSGRERESVSVTIGYSIAYEVPPEQLHRLREVV